MKYVFLVCFAALLAGSLITYNNLPDMRSDRPVIYWVTDDNPARTEQVKIFNQQWLPGQENAPPTLLRLDAAAATDDLTKKIVQSVAGVGGDLIDLWMGGNMRFFDQMALLRPVTEQAQTLGFGPDKTFPALREDVGITSDDGTYTQFQFPCNVACDMFLVNKKTLRKYEQPIPSMRWTVDEFERMGKAYVAAANAGNPRLRNFYASSVPLEVLRRSFGGSRYNETMTRCTLDQPFSIQALKKIDQWMHVDRLIPTEGDLQSISTQSGYGGQGPQLFFMGHIVLMNTSRHTIIQTRQFDVQLKKEGKPPMDLGLVEPPHGGFPNVFIGTRAASVYAGSKHPERAVWFLKYLASEDYNMQIVRDGDGLPPNPEFCKTEEYLRPPDHPNEWEVHANWAEAALVDGVGNSYSPFVLHDTAARIDEEEYDKFIYGQQTAEQAGAAMTRRINFEIDRNLREKPKLRPRYEALTQRQAQIDRLKSEGRKIPANLILNPYHLAYYKAKGMLDE
jgi:multiple sugar transport system substrate-binding protein